MRKKAETDKTISNVLKIISGFSVALMAVGLALHYVRGGRTDLAQNLRTFGFVETLAGVVQLNPVALMTLGIIILIGTPIIRAIGVFFSFWFIEKDKLYALVSLGVLVILGASLFVPGVK